MERDDYKILFGETKYFSVKRKTETEELKIEEIKTNYGEEPEFPADSDGWEWLKIDMWGEDPVAKLEVKSGVYWEKKWFDKSDNRNKDLDMGIIRIIGRYWEEGKEDEFEVKLKTTNNAEMKIKVVKPTAGFEQALAVMYYKWNPGEKVNGYASYHKKVLNNSKRFLPRSK